MGGKTKQSQRTKNSVRPSSSGRSAELLSSTIKLDSTLVPGKELPVLFPSLNVAAIDQGLNPEYSVCFKQLTKKDPHTKTKALQKIAGLLKNGNVDDAVAALTSWTNHYQILVTDSDRRVREATQTCHGALVSVCGRRVAPALRRLLPAWLLAYNDDHVLASELARTQLESTFPGFKLGEALSFCKAEIIMLLLDNLSGNTAAMLSKKVDNPDERQIQVDRILASSLRALQLFIEKLPESHDEWLWEKLRLLLQSVEFWKLFVHQSEHIRASWYSVCGQICFREGPRLGALPERLRIGKALVSTPERGAVAAQRWAAVLLLMHRVEDWYTWFERKDLLVKRLLEVLNNGGWGEAQPLANMLLPLLSKLPDDLVTKEFYTVFFNAFITGLNNKRLLSSKSERQTWIKMLEECLRYLSIQNHEYVSEVITYVHRTWLENVFAITEDQAKNHLIKCSATHMAEMVKYWLKKTKEENCEKYDQLIRNFWLNIGSIVTKHIDRLVEIDNLQELIDSHILLLKTLKATFVSEGKKLRRIHFEDQGVEDLPSPTEIVDVTIVDRFQHNLSDVVDNTCCNYFEYANNKNVFHKVFDALLKFIVQFEGRNLFMALAKHFKQDSVYGFYEIVLKPLLIGDKMCEAMVDTVFVIMKYMSEDEQDGMFESFSQFPPALVEDVLCRAAYLPHCRRSAARRWLRGPTAERCVVQLAGREDDAATSLLLACLGLADDGEPLVSSSAVSRAVERLSASCSAAAALALTTLALAPHPQHCLHAAPLLMALFQRSLESSEFEETQKTRWRDALLELPRDAREPLISRARSLLHSHVFKDLENLDIDRVTYAASLYPDLFVANENDKITTEIVSHIKELFGIETEKPKVPLEVFALRCDIIDGCVNCPFEDDNEFVEIIVDGCGDECEELTKRDLVVFLYKVLFRTLVINATLCENDAFENDDAIVELLKDTFVVEEFNGIFYDAAVLDVLVRRYAFWLDYDVIIKGKKCLESTIDNILSIITPEIKQGLSIHFAKNAAAKGYYWSYAKKLFDDKVSANNSASPNEPKTQESGEDGTELKSKDEAGDVNKETESADMLNAGASADDVTGNGYFHNLQATNNSCSSTIQLVMSRTVLAAHARDPLLCEQLVRDSSAGKAPADVIIEAYYKYNHVMVYKTDLSIAPLSMIISNAAIIDFLEEAVRTRGWDLPAQQWDFTTISICSLLESLTMSSRHWGCCKVAVLSRALFKLLVTVLEFIRGVRSQAEKTLPPNHILALPTEWIEVFAPDVTKHMLDLLMIALEPDEKPMTACRVATINGLIAGLGQLQRPVKGSAPPPMPRAGQLHRSACAALTRVAPPAVKYLAFSALNYVTEPLVLEDAEKLASWSSPDSPPTFSLSYYDDAMVHLQDLMDAALSNIKECEGTCEVLPDTDSHSVALGHLLLSAQLLRHCDCARGDLAQYYIELLRQGAYGGGLMASCVRLLPCDSLSAAVRADTGDLTKFRPAFEKLPPLDVYRKCNSDTISALACHVLCETLGGAAAGEARSWAGALGARPGAALRRVVAACAAPCLRRRLLTPLAARAHELPDATVAVQLARAEVTCALELDDRTLELVLKLADEHPLVPPTVISPVNSPAPDTHWMVLYLAYQNGSLLNALKMWISAVTARVQSSPQCYICYCRLHPSSGRLPTVPCHQCRNKFHSPCLRKWFSTSNKSNCPLCRTKF